MGKYREMAFFHSVTSSASRFDLQGFGSIRIKWVEESLLSSVLPWVGSWDAVDAMVVRNLESLDNMRYNRIRDAGLYTGASSIRPRLRTDAELRRRDVAQAPLSSDRKSVV